MKVTEFVEDFKNAKVVNSKIAPTAVEDYIHEKLEIKDYIPFVEKKEIVKTIVEENMTITDGYKKINSINQFLSFVTSMMVSHTNLEFDNPYQDYDALCQSNLLNAVISCFKEDYDSCEVLLKMAVADEMQDNTTPAIVAQFLNKISGSLDTFSEVLREKVDEFDIGNILDSANVSEENLDLIKGLFNI